MPGFIEDFYYGNIEPQQMNSSIEGNISKKLKSLVEKEELLDKELKNEIKECFDNYKDSYNEFLNICCLDSFTSGFKLGAGFAYDIFKK